MARLLYKYPLFAHNSLSFLSTLTSACSPTTSAHSPTTYRHHIPLWVQICMPTFFFRPFLSSMCVLSLICLLCSACFHVLVILSSSPSLMPSGRPGPQAIHCGAANLAIAGTVRGALSPSSSAVGTAADPPASSLSVGASHSAPGAGGRVHSTQTAGPKPYCLRCSKRLAANPRACCERPTRHNVCLSCRRKAKKCLPVSFLPFRTYFLMFIAR